MESFWACSPRVRQSMFIIVFIESSSRHETIVISQGEVSFDYATISNTLDVRVRYTAGIWILDEQIYMVYEYCEDRCKIKITLAVGAHINLPSKKIDCELYTLWCYCLRELWAEQQNNICLYNIIYKTRFVVRQLGPGYTHHSIRWMLR